MNERIKQLAKDSDLIRYDSDGNITQVEKFAELIVRECCFTGEQWANGLFDPKHYAFVNKMIKLHFGVEE